MKVLSEQVSDGANCALGDDVKTIVMVECILIILIIKANEMHYFSNLF